MYVRSGIWMTFKKSCFFEWLRRIVYLFPFVEFSFSNFLFTFDIGHKQIARSNVTKCWLLYKYSYTHYTFPTTKDESQFSTSLWSLFFETWPYTHTLACSASLQFC